MLDRRSAQLGAGTGIAYVALTLAGSSLGGGGNGPPESASPSRLAAYLVAHPAGPRQWTAAFLELLALFALLAFVAHLYTALRRRDPDGALPLVALGAGVVSVAIKLGSFGPAFAAHYRAKELSPQLIAALLDINSVGFALTMALTGLMLASASAAALRTPVLPRWLAWAGLGISLLLIATVPMAITTGFGPAFLLGLLWIVATSVVLIRNPKAEIGAPKPDRSDALPFAA